MTLYLLGFTAIAVGVARGGFVYYALGAMVLAGSLYIFRKCKPLEDAEN